MTRSVIIYRTKTAKRNELVALFEQLRLLDVLSDQPGFLAAELHASLEDDDELVLASSWASAEHHERWLASETLADLDARLGAVLAVEPEIRLYRVVEAIG
jgi:quinol monooxygenase YgiN